MRHLLLMPMLCVTGVATAQDWASFRGPGGQGIAAATELPATFDDDNVLWRVPAGKGHSSPVLWKDRLFLTREAAEGGLREVVCFDAGTGKEIWAAGSPYESHRQHRFNSFASATPALDAKGIYVVWTSGETVVALALDHDGKERWRRELGAFRAQHGSGSSPIVHRDLLLVANEHEGEGSFLMGLDTVSGETRWRLERKSQRASYATPVVCNVGGPLALFASTAHGLTAVDPGSGQIRFEVGLDFRERVVATPCVAGDLVLLATGAGGGGLECAVVQVPDASGEEAKVLYRPRRSLPYVPSTLGLAGRFYLFQDGGVVTCLTASSGDVLWRERLDGTFFSSPVSDGKTIYIADREGTLFTLGAGERFERRGAFGLGGPVFATPAIAHGRLYVRTSDHLVCLAPAKDR